MRTQSRPGSMLGQFSNVTLSDDRSSDAISLLEFTGYAIFLKWTGAGTDGVFKLQGAVSVGTPADWEDISGATVTASGAGQAMFTIGNAYYTHVRVVFTHGSGTGTLSVANFVGKVN